MPKLKGAIVGFGFIAVEGHLPALTQSADLEIVAVFDQDPERKAVAADKLPHGRFYNSADALFANEKLDFVDIATSPASHIEYLRAAMKRGLHVLCEKPLVLSEGHLQEIADYLASSSKTVYTSHNWKFAPIFLKTSELLRSNRIGEIKRIRYEVLRTGPSAAVTTGKNNVNWRLQPELSGGGILVDHGWHAFYVLCGWAGGKPRRVSGSLENRKFKDLAVEDTATVKIDFDTSEAELFFTWTADERKNAITIAGTRGELKILDDVIHCVNDEGEKKYSFDEVLSKGSHHPEWYPFVMRDFVRSMTDREFRDGNFREAALSLLLTDGAQRSHRDGSRSAPLDLKFIEGGD
ncbi:MAG: Gfo/Idh/MocA family oxidoreductase [Nitrospinae bacterium]|nr:Gfo/Idh/MocA family oxidoreductase [Nitrospinota bacterium]